jgi:hypothetical protein
LKKRTKKLLSVWVLACSPAFLSGCDRSYLVASAWAPPAETETLDRVTHRGPANLPPVTSDAGTIWPSPPEPVPTMLDLEKTVATHAPMTRQRGGYGLCRQTPAGPPKGVSLGLCYAR